MMSPTSQIATRALLVIGWVLGFTTTCFMNSAQADILDDCVAREMQAHAIPGVSLAIIQDGQMISARAYGNVEVGGRKG